MSSSEDDCSDASSLPTNNATLPSLLEQQQQSSSSSSSRSRSGGSASATVIPVKGKKQMTAEEKEKLQQRTLEGLKTKAANKQKTQNEEFQNRLQSAIAGSDLAAAHDRLLWCTQEHNIREGKQKKTNKVMKVKKKCDKAVIKPCCHSAEKKAAHVRKSLAEYLLKADDKSIENGNAFVAMLASGSGHAWPDHVYWLRKKNTGATEERNGNQKRSPQFGGRSWTPQAFLTVVIMGELVSPLCMKCICGADDQQQHVEEDKSFVCVNPYHYEPISSRSFTSRKILAQTNSSHQQSVSNGIPPLATATTVGTGTGSSLLPPEQIHGQQQQMIPNGAQQHNSLVSMNASPPHVEPALGTVNFHLNQGSNSSSHILAAQDAVPAGHFTNNAPLSANLQSQTTAQGMQPETVVATPPQYSHVQASGQQQPLCYGMPSYNMASVASFVGAAFAPHNPLIVVHDPQNDFPFTAAHQQQPPPVSQLSDWYQQQQLMMGPALASNQLPFPAGRSLNGTGQHPHQNQQATATEQFTTGNNSLYARQHQQPAFGQLAATTTTNVAQHNAVQPYQNPYYQGQQQMQMAQEIPYLQHHPRPMALPHHNGVQQPAVAHHQIEYQPNPGHVFAYNPYQAN